MAELKEVFQRIQQQETPHAYFATYTAMLEFRELLAQEHLIEKKRRCTNDLYFLESSDQAQYPYSLHIAHLYSNLMNTYGDNGNILMLKYVAEKLGAPCHC